MTKTVPQSSETGGDYVKFSNWYMDDGFFYNNGWLPWVDEVGCFPCICGEHGLRCHLVGAFYGLNGGINEQAVHEERA